MRAHELRFTVDETRTYLCGLNLELSPSDIGILNERTEGWIAGLQLAALSLREQANPAGFIRNFSGDHRFVLDYLLDEVFAQQDGEVQDFLLRTSVLERLCAPLCDTVVYGDAAAGASQTVLEALEQANLFIVALDDKGYLYRYHYLFADLLRHRLKQVGANQISELHRCAAAWFEAQGWTDEALPHIFAVGDAIWAGRLVEEAGAVTLWGHGEIATLLGWLEQLPEALIAASPKLCLLYAWIFYQTSQLDKLDPYLERAEAQLLEAGRAGRARGAATSSDAGLEHRSLLGGVAVIRAFVARLESCSKAAERYSQEALRRLPAHELRLRGLVAASKAESFYLCGDLTAAAAACKEASAHCQASGTLFPALWMLRRVAEIQTLQGQLRHVADTCQAMRAVADERGNQHPAVAGLADIQQGELLREWNALEVAASLLTTGIERGRRVANPRIYQAGYIALARVLQAQGQEVEVLETIEAAVRAEKSYQTGWGLPLATAYRARLWLAQGEVTAAARWVQERGLSTAQKPCYGLEVEQLTLVRVLITQGHTEDVVGWLGRLCQAAQSGERTGRVLETQILLALAHHARGASERAIAALAQALTLAEPEGYVRLFVDEGEPMAHLLTEIAARGAATTHVSRYAVKLCAPFVQPPRPLPRQD